MGCEVCLFDGKGLTRCAVVTAINGDQLVFTSEHSIEKHPAASRSLTLFAALIKGQRMEWCIEKAVELGVARVVPVITERCVVRLKPGKETNNKLIRWNRIAAEACRQCQRAWLPEIVAPLTLKQAIAMAAGLDCCFTAALLPDTIPLVEAVSRLEKSQNNLGLFIGPEGDFTPDELCTLKTAGTTMVSRGPNTLRAETASICGIAVILTTDGRGDRG